MGFLDIFRSSKASGLPRPSQEDIRRYATVILGVRETMPERFREIQLNVRSLSCGDEPSPEGQQVREKCKGWTQDDFFDLSVMLDTEPSRRQMVKLRSNCLRSINPISQSLILTCQR